MCLVVKSNLFFFLGAVLSLLDLYFSPLSRVWYNIYISILMKKSIDTSILDVAVQLATHIGAFVTSPTSESIRWFCFSNPSRPRSENKRDPTITCLRSACIDDTKKDACVPFVNIRDNANRKRMCLPHIDCIPIAFTASVKNATSQSRVSYMQKGFFLSSTN